MAERWPRLRPVPVIEKLCKISVIDGGSIFAPKIISKIAELEFINFGEPATPSGGYFIENLKQCSYLKCSYLKMGSHGNALMIFTTVLKRDAVS